MEMEWYWALATLIGMVIFFMAMGIPVALTFITTNIIGVIIFSENYYYQFVVNIYIFCFLILVN